MITKHRLVARGFEPALALLPSKLDSVEARVQMLATAMQESELEHRRQMGNGPARSFFQMERGGGVLGVLTHRASKDHAARICTLRGVVPTSEAAWAAIEQDDVLASAFARLLLLTDALALPTIFDAQGGWSYYLRLWRPGKPHPELWPANHTAAREFILQYEGM